MADDDVLVSDVGSHELAIAQNVPAYEPNTCVVSNGLAAMGIAVPGAVAADLAVDANVVAGTGDGGFPMNGAELVTATRLDCGFTVVVFEDGEYQMIAEEQLDHRGETFDRPRRPLTWSRSRNVSASTPTAPRATTNSGTFWTKSFPPPNCRWWRSPSSEP